MRTLPRLLLAAMAVAVFVPLGHQAPRAAVAAPAADLPVLLRDVQAGQFNLTPPAPTTAHPEVIQPDTQIEPSIAVNPANDQNAVAAFQEGRVAGGGDMTNGWATTFDGGRTWTYGDFPCLTYTVPGPGCPNGGPYDRASDAVVAFGPGNTVYANHLIFDDSTGGGTRSAIGVNVSHDGGRTWGPPIVFQDDNNQGLNDKNWVVVDNSNALGHHLGRVYVVWDIVASVVFNYCDSNCDVGPGLPGSGWLPNFLPVYPGQGISSIPLVLPNGSLAVVFHTDANAAPTYSPGEQPASPSTSAIDMVLAPVAGALPAPIPLEVPRGVTDDQGKPVRLQRASDGTLISADVDLNNGNIYVGWADGRLRTDAANDAFFTVSTDSGVTWSPPARINPGAAGDNVDHYNVTLAVGPDGSVRASYRQRQEAADPTQFSPYIDTYYQQSTDAGTTWSPPLLVNRVRTNAFYGAFSRNGLFEGDYNQIAAGGKYSYIVRDEAYPTSPGEQPGLILKSGVLTGNPAGCPGGTLVPACMTHQHQRTWVAVVGPPQAATVAAASPSPAPSPAASPVAAPLPNTSASQVGGLVPWAPWILAGLLLLTLGRRRRPHPGGSA